MTDHETLEGHTHGERHSDVPTALALRVKALQSLLLEKGLVAQEALDRIIEAYESRIGPHIGARVVARAWVDAAYRLRLLEDGNAAVASLGAPNREGTRLVAVENTAQIHNVVVCTLCSCYPMSLLGLPPVWYKSAPFRSRVVMDPRSVLAEFGTEVADDVEVRVWDSNSEVRYLVIPERPPGTQHLSEEDLATLVGRNAMIGVERAKTPGAAAR
ncbi:MAG: nitrile hydratase subunit alpha [Acidimicrobiia bacterium]|nr:nitrile hydratase subunit alpha [Acidimicrobiia bacterium]